MNVSLSSPPLSLQHGYIAKNIRSGTDLLGDIITDDTQLKELNKINKFDAIEKFLKIKHTSYVGPDQGAQTYGEIVKDGKVVATLSNHGWLTTTNALAGKLGEFGGKDENGKNGPILAQARAEKIMKAIGGELVLKETALTQNQYEALPKRVGVLNRQAMERDEDYIMLLKMQLAREAFEREQAANPETSRQKSAAIAED